MKERLTTGIARATEADVLVDIVDAPIRTDPREIGPSSRSMGQGRAHRRAQIATPASAAGRRTCQTGEGGHPERGGAVRCPSAAPAEATANNASRLPGCPPSPV